MDLNGLADPFVKVRLHPDPTEDPDFNRQTKYMPNTLTPEWQQTVVFMNCFKRTLKRRVLEVTVWDFDRLKTNDFMGQALINLGDKQLLDGRPHWYPLHKMEPVILPSAKKTPPSARTAPVESAKLSRTQRETIDRRGMGIKEHPKDYSTSHR
ncbi:protein piccolo [Clonorchis sinensis]|uniref:Protein piccolo n=1 Tax=Clonorchis sinensis TaxID=79923 RepID=G7Y3E1_CLOSI|nr:protein piccolo [Clonorchis sinensis]